MLACVPKAKLAKHTIAGKAGSPHTAAGKAKSPHKSGQTKRHSCRQKQSTELTYSCSQTKQHSLHAKAKHRAHIQLQPNQVTQLQGFHQQVRAPYHIKDAVLRELIGLGKVQVVTRSSKLSRSGK